MNMVIDCPLCRESGLPPGNLVHPLTGEVGYCPCRPRRIAQWAIPKSNVYKKYLSATFTMFPNEKFVNQQEVINACQAYVENWAGVKDTGLCLSILGTEPGMGKSHLASAICNYLTRNFWTQSVEDQDVCLFVNVSAWFSDWASLYARFPDEKARYEEREFRNEKEMLGIRENRMRKTQLLVLDDMTKFNTADPTKVQKLFDVIEARVINCLPIVVTENADSWDQVAAKLGMKNGATIVDRLIRNGDTIFIKTPAPELKRGKKK